MSRELDRLWTALDMPGVDVDRAALTSLLEGPWRLHSSSIEKVSKLLTCSHASVVRVFPKQEADC